MFLEFIHQKEERLEDVQRMLMDPDLMKDMKKYTALNKEFRSLETFVFKGKQYKEVVGNIETCRDILNNETDEEMREMAKEEIEPLENEKISLEEELKVLLIPQDPNDSKPAILEIRAGTGGDEAAIFAGDLFRMYQRFCERKGLKFEVNELSEGSMGGYKEIIVTVSGEDAYGTLKFESGVHRVQRVPATEAQGRIHTSAATVAVMPEADEFDVELNMNDVRIDTFCASGAGGQSVNTTYSAVRLTHIPTGLVVSMQDERSQLKNKDKAFGILRSRLYDLELSKVKNEEAALRKSLVSSGDRSAKIRTYNYPQNRVTDHRIDLTLYNLANIVEGDLDELIEKLRIAENAGKVAELEAAN
ncbi:MAG: peptide chain release factor 1 [Bacteroidia bacterium]|nr:peptide chain release factor 1 [Bacteroidia bacterium]